MFGQIKLKLISITVVFILRYVSAQFITDDVKYRVVNGQPAILGEIPYQVSFKRELNNKLYSNFCGGSLIKPTQVLSAAHCFAQDETLCGKPVIEDFRRVYAVAGNLETVALFTAVNSHGQWRRLKNVYVPSDYKFPRSDVAVVHLKKKFYENGHIKCIPYASKYINYKDMECQISGYGRTVLPLKSAQTSPNLLKAYTRLINAGVCDNLHGINMKKFICAQHRVAATSQGDSGGPLVCKGTNDPAELSDGIVVGIVCAFARPGGSIYTRTSAYKNFIDRGAANTLSKADITFFILNISLIKNILIYFFVLILVFLFCAK